MITVCIQRGLAGLALGRAIAPGQRAKAAQLVEDRTEALDRQVAVLRRLRDCVHDPDNTSGSVLLDLRTLGDAQPALCSLGVARIPGAVPPGTSLEARMAPGIILLVLIATLLAFSVFRVRRKMGMGGATGRMWTVAIIGIALGLLVLWVFQTQN